MIMFIMNFKRKRTDTKFLVKNCSEKPFHYEYISRRYSRKWMFSFPLNLVDADGLVVADCLKENGSRLVTFV